MGVDSGKTHLIHFTNASLDFWSRIPEELKESGDQWVRFFPLLYFPSSRRQEYVVDDGESTSLCWVIPPAGFDHTPNGVRQPSVLTWFRWTRRPLPGSSTENGDAGPGHSITLGQNPREYLISTGRRIERC